MVILLKSDMGYYPRSRLAKMMLFQTKTTKNATPIERTAPQVTTAVTSCHLFATT